MWMLISGMKTIIWLMFTTHRDSILDLTEVSKIIYTASWDADIPTTRPILVP